MYVTIGFGGPPSVRDALFPGLGFSQLLNVTPSAVEHSIVDIGSYEAAQNPDGLQVDTNAYAVLALPGHRLVTDAGGNSLLDVGADGSISTVTTFPKVISGFGPADAVPTEVVLGPDGAYYVSNLSGVPFTPGKALVWRVSPDGTKTVYADGSRRSPTSRSAPTDRSTCSSTQRLSSSAGRARSSASHRAARARPSTRREGCSAQRASWSGLTARSTSPTSAPRPTSAKC